MDSRLNVSENKKHMQKKAQRPQVEGSTDKEWTPSSENLSTHSLTNSPRKRKLEISEVKSTTLRVWSEEDEMAILQGHLDYSSINKAKPSTSYDAFLNFVKDKLQTETTKAQLRNKLKGLKRKYQGNVAKRSFSKPHEEKIFKLSKRIWGHGEKVKSIETNKIDEKNVGGSSSGMYSDMVLGGGSAADVEDWFKRNPGQLISEKDRKKMLAKSRSVKVAKARLYLKEIEVMEKQTKLAIDALKAIHK
ncbi:probable transcription factor At4g00390 [Lycium barbarum]|uniref:probable transcription factor At4g00390 n=1 Tax=Lycium barbarum TaxID=112863 RepID=UPI00293F23B4|nr:probable transcription factor At4g00390 [Lycium barbarum]